MILYKDNFITKDIFEALLKCDSDIVMNMLRNKIVMKSIRDYDTIDETEMNKWLRENCAGLIYFINEGNTYRDHIIYYFEKEEDAIAFKLRWQ